MSWPCKIGSGRNEKNIFSPLGFEYTMRTCFESKNFFKFLPWAEQSATQLFSLSSLTKTAGYFFQFLDIWWSSLDVMDDFNVISRMVIFHFGEINKSWFWVLSIFFFLIFFLIRYIFYNLKCNKELKQCKKYWQNWKSWFVYFTEMENHRCGNKLKIIHYVQTWPSDVKNLNKSIQPFL